MKLESILFKVTVFSLSFSLLGFSPAAAAEPPISPKMVDVWCAAKVIPAATKITVEDVKLEQWPADQVPPHAAVRLEDILGRRPRLQIFESEPIIPAKLADPKETAPTTVKYWYVVNVAVSDGSSLKRYIGTSRLREKNFVKQLTGRTPIVLSDLYVPPDDERIPGVRVGEHTLYFANIVYLNPKFIVSVQPLKDSLLERLLGDR